MSIFSIIFTFDKSVGTLKNRVEISALKDRILTSVVKEACSEIGIDFNEHFQVLNSNGKILDNNFSIECNEVTDGSQLLIIFPDKVNYLQDNYISHLVTTNRLWKPLSIIAVLLSIFGLIVLITIYVINYMKILSYSVVIDAGSTSSKVYLYSWPSNKFLYNADVTQVTSCKAEPGISNYEDNPVLSFDGIKDCLDRDIMPKIPKDKKDISFIYLGATAGMRMLSYKNPNATQKIMNFQRKSLSKYALKINNTLTDISIIPGSIEGLTGWITVNYLLNNFPKTNMISRPIIGALDMGGASTQVTFLDSTPSNSTDLFYLNLYGKPYTIYSHSYLCYGKSQAELRFLAVLLLRTNFSLNTKNPCMQLGEEAIFSIEELFFKPCVLGKFAIENYGYEIIPPKYLVEEKANFTFNGTSDFNQCLELVKSLFNNSKCENMSQCTFNGVYQPKLSGKFGAFSAYPLIKEHLNPKNENLNFYQYEEKLKIMCNNTNKFSTFTEDPYAKWLCFDLTFLIEMLRLIGFDKSNWNDIEFITTIGDYSVGWSLGYLIDKTSLIPKEKHFLPIEDYLFGIIFAVLILILIFGVVFIVISIRINIHKSSWPQVRCDDNEEQNLLSSTSLRE